MSVRFYIPAPPALFHHITSSETVYFRDVVPVGILTAVTFSILPPPPWQDFCSRKSKNQLLFSPCDKNQLPYSLPTSHVTNNFVCDLPTWIFLVTQYIPALTLQRNFACGCFVVNVLTIQCWCSQTIYKERVPFFLYSNHNFVLG
jgi:hypothetical protein